MFKVMITLLALSITSSMACSKIGEEEVEDAKPAADAADAAEAKKGNPSIKSLEEQVASTPIPITGTTRAPIM